MPSLALPGQRPQHILPSSRSLQPHNCISIPTRIDPSLRHRIAQRLIHADGQHKRGLANGFAFEYRVFVVGLRPQVYAEVLRHIARCGYFVGAGGVGAQLARVVPHQLLGGEPAHALHKAAFYLAYVDGGES
jgi:hypothetical protein